MNLLPDAAAYLKKRIAQDLQSSRLSTSFVAWLLPDMVNLESLRVGAIQIAANAKGSQRRYRDVAELAFASECQLLDNDGKRSLNDGLRWLSGRSHRVSGQPADFCTDPISLIGLALAVRNQAKAEKEWLRSACLVALQHTSGWKSSLVTVAENLLGNHGDIDSPEIKVVTFSKGLLEEELSSEDKSQVISNLKASTLAEIESSHAVIQLAAIRHIESGMPRISVHSANVGDVVALLRSMPMGLQRWTWEDTAKTTTSQPRKWHIDHEYHVQNLVWLLLSPIFPDAKYEENKSAVGSVHPRLDIVVPSLRLIIEVKFWRKSVKSEKMIRELAEDASLYFTSDSPYTTLVPFIWDDAARTEEHPLLISGLREIKGIVDAVLISKPARMTELTN